MAEPTRSNPLRELGIALGASIVTAVVILGWKSPETTEIADAITEVLHGRTAAGGKIQKSTFADVVNEHFASWAKGEKALAVGRIQELLRDPAVKGEAAAALAMIHSYLQAREKLVQRGLVKSELLSVMPTDLLNRAVRPHLEAGFRENRDYLAALRRELFATPDAPTLTGIAQGALGDCYLISTVGSLLTHHPGAIREMIAAKPDGSYEITFLDGQKLRVPEVTDGMIVLGARAGNQGLWLHVLETAYGYHRLANRIPDGELPEDTLNLGFPSHVMKLFTGRTAGVFVIPPAEAKTSLTEERVRRLIIDGVRTKALMTLGAQEGRTGILPPRIIGHHAYAVLGYDAAKDCVRVWNPWGAHLNYRPRGEPGLIHGYTIVNGVFEVPIREFGQVFCVISHDNVVTTKSG